MSTREALGYWREPPAGQLAAASLEWLAPWRVGLQVWVGVLDGKPVASVSRQPGNGNGCSAKLDGSMWTSQEPEALADRLKVKEALYRGFQTVPQAKAIENAMAVARLQGESHA